MKKKHQNNSVINIEAPAVVNMDILAYATDSEIENRQHQLNSEKLQASNRGYDPYLWEVELAYVQREIGIRETRKNAHELYLKNNPEAVDMAYVSNDSDEFILN